jgi:hypothetical protein
MKRESEENLCLSARGGHVTRSPATFPARGFISIGCPFDHHPRLHPIHETCFPLMASILCYVMRKVLCTAGLWEGAGHLARISVSENPNELFLRGCIILK